MPAQITTIDRATAKRLAAEAQTCLEAVAEKHGLSVTYKGGSFDPATGVFTPKFEFSVAGAEQASFERDAMLFGYEPSDYRREFESRGETYRLVGFNRRARTMPLLAERVSDGKRFKMHRGTPQNAWALAALSK